jgi:hypothetical protein
MLKLRTGHQVSILTSDLNYFNISLNPFCTSLSKFDFINFTLSQLLNPANSFTLFASALRKVSVGVNA